MPLDHAHPAVLEGRPVMFEGLKMAPAVSGEPNLTTRELVTALYRAMAQTVSEQLKSCRESEEKP